MVNAVVHSLDGSVECVGALKGANDLLRPTVPVVIGVSGTIRHGRRSLRTVALRRARVRPVCCAG